ncbi:hypothetical protein ElyMa_006803900 [Elysia marginata]|uniref:Uncharacterized protein n=1 Tax=Elysia marginata TaxID=1093978 RepID=A0AAV4J4Z4_9GAST|nr:hypothetical protein ElyMa_006803900 [Elysia marginata]
MRSSNQYRTAVIHLFPLPLFILQPLYITQKIPHSPHPNPPTLHSMSANFVSVRASRASSSYGELGQLAAADRLSHPLHSDPPPVWRRDGPVTTPRRVVPLTTKSRNFLLTPARW